MQYNITYREKDNSWQYIISYKVNGKWKQKSKQGFPLNRKGKQQAKDAALKALDKLKENIQLKTNSDFEGITFEQFGKEYLEHTKLYREYKTVESTQTVLNKFCELNDVELSKITTLHIQRVVDNLSIQQLNPNTIKYYLKKLTIIFNAAKNQYNIINTIPTKNVKVTESKSINKKALTDAEVKQLLENLKTTKYYLLVFIAVNTGMRLGEILGLTWNDVDFKNNIISVNKQWKRLKNGNWGSGELKTKNSNRLIPISKSVVKELMNYKNLINIDNRIFQFKNKGNLTTSLSKLFKFYNYDISVHELRHTYATKLIANGLDFKTVASILGHDVQQTIKTYSHVNSDMLNKAKNLIENIF